MVIACACEGPLGQPQGETVACLRCHRTYPVKEAMQILKLLRLASREMDNDGKPANEHVRRTALNKAAYRLAALKLRAIDEEDLQPVAPTPAPPPVYQQPFYYSPVWPYASNTFNVGTIFIRVTTA